MVDALNIRRQGGIIPLPVSFEVIRETALARGLIILDEGADQDPRHYRFMIIKVAPEHELLFWTTFTSGGRRVTETFPDHAHLFAEAVNDF